MSKTVFISYCHKQAKWVQLSLVPCLEAGGAEVLIDYKQFKAGRPVVGQMDAAQDKADLSVLVLSPDYLASPYCVHEMNRAIKRDPRFKSGSVVPIKRVECTIPHKVKIPNPLFVDLRNDKDTGQWNLLLQACEVDLGATAPDWLRARDMIVYFLRRNQSVNLVVSRNPKWRKLLEHICTSFIDDLREVDLESGATVSQRGFVAEILRVCGKPEPTSRTSEALVDKLNHIISKGLLTRIAIKHFDMVIHRSDYDSTIFATLRHFMQLRKLALLLQSRSPVTSLLPQDHPFSSIKIKTVELKWRK